MISTGRCTASTSACVDAACTACRRRRRSRAVCAGAGHVLLQLWSERAGTKDVPVEAAAVSDEGSEPEGDPAPVPEDTVALLTQAKVAECCLAVLDAAITARDPAIAREACRLAANMAAADPSPLGGRNSPYPRRALALILRHTSSRAVADAGLDLCEALAQAGHLDISASSVLAADSGVNEAHGICSCMPRGGVRIDNLKRVADRDRKVDALRAAERRSSIGKLFGHGGCRDCGLACPGWQPGAMPIEWCVLTPCCLRAGAVPCTPHLLTTGPQSLLRVLRGNAHTRATVRRCRPHG